MLRLAGKVAIVTGASAGIGAATAKRLVAEGARVVLADLNIAAVEKLAAELVQAGGEAAARQFDLLSEDSIRALIEWTVARFGALNILHNNAADTRVEQMSADMAIADMSIDTWDRAFAANTRGTMLMIKHAIPAMLHAGGGSIINTSSGAAARGDLFNPAYAASKAAINCLTLYVATQYGRQGIRCNAVSPGLIVTPTVKAVVPAEQIQRIEQHALLPYLGAAEDIAATVAFLASDDARNISGHVVPVDGGYASHMPHVGEILSR
jgi:NAD(P)-dependent dehydrogenase (short-subunit alcohol dehydrogenase family)